MNHANLTNQQYEALLELSDIAASYADNPSQSDGFLRRIVERVNQCLNAPGRIGEVSLFFRDPFKDRLTLVASTVEEQNPNRTPGEHFETYGEQYDPADKVYYYELYDKLLPAGSDRFNRDFRRRRGTTGWIGLTGCSLKLVGKQSDEVIRAQFPSDGTFQCLLRQYGPPESGRDFSRVSKTQYLGTPVVSASNSHVVFGVLRYTAKLAQPFLDNCDLEFLRRVARLIAKLIHNLNLTKQLSRKLLLPPALENFRRSGNYEEFLQFISGFLQGSFSIARN